MEEEVDEPEGTIIVKLLMSTSIVNCIVTCRRTLIPDSRRVLISFGY